MSHGDFLWFYQAVPESSHIWPLAPTLDCQWCAEDVCLISRGWSAAWWSPRPFQHAAFSFRKHWQQYFWLCTCLLQKCLAHSSLFFFMDHSTLMQAPFFAFSFAVGQVTHTQGMSGHQNSSPGEWSQYQPQRVQEVFVLLGMWCDSCDVLCRAKTWTEWSSLCPFQLGIFFDPVIFVAQLSERCIFLSAKEFGLHTCGFIVIS